MATTPYKLPYKFSFVMQNNTKFQDEVLSIHKELSGAILHDDLESCIASFDFIVTHFLLTWDDGPDQRQAHYYNVNGLKDLLGRAHSSKNRLKSLCESFCNDGEGNTKKA